MAKLWCHNLYNHKYTYSVRNDAVTQALICEHKFVVLSKISTYVVTVPKTKFLWIKGTVLNGVKILEKKMTESGNGNRK